MNTTFEQQIDQRLDRIEQALSIHNGQDKYLDLEGVCALLGIAKRTYYQNNQDYNFRKYKFGRSLRFDRAEVIAWMNEKINSAVYWIQYLNQQKKNTTS